MPSPRWWKEFYAEERATLGRRGMESLLREAPEIALSKGGALIFPHTRLSVSGTQTAAAALAVLKSGHGTVVALGVLHLGSRRSDSGLRGIHGADAPFDKAIWRDEFSLDNFDAMLTLAAEQYGTPKPRLISRYPFLTGTEPQTLPGMDELQQLLNQGAAIVASADMIHHGVGYDTPIELLRERNDPSSLTWARECIQSSLERLPRGDYAGFIADCNSIRSDFRDGAPLLAKLLRNFTANIKDLQLVDYSGVLDSSEPTWVAAALVELLFEIPPK